MLFDNSTRTIKSKFVWADQEEGDEFPLIKNMFVWADREEGDAFPPLTKDLPKNEEKEVLQNKGTFPAEPPVMGALPTNNKKEVVPTKEPHPDEKKVLVIYSLDVGSMTHDEYYALYPKDSVRTPEFLNSYVGTIF